MDSRTSIPRVQLEHAEALLRGVLVADFQHDAKGDAVSLRRMLAHLVNIHHAVCVYTDRHTHAARRLVDFANVTDRMASRYPANATGLTRLVAAFRAAGAGLSEANGVPVTARAASPESTGAS
jgi:hypothetical protein